MLFSWAGLARPDANRETRAQDWEQKMRDTTEEVNRLEREKQELQEEAQKAQSSSCVVHGVG